MAVPGILGQLWGPCAGLALPGSAGLGHHPGALPGHRGTGGQVTLPSFHWDTTPGFSHSWGTERDSQKRGKFHSEFIPMRCSHQSISQVRLSLSLLQVLVPGQSWYLCGFQDQAHPAANWECLRNVPNAFGAPLQSATCAGDQINPQLRKWKTRHLIV